jgi:hypothetical protein
MNVGLVNPSAVPLHLTVEAHFVHWFAVMPSGGSAATPPVDALSTFIVPTYWDEDPSVVEPLHVDLPPWGWRQLNDLSGLVGCNAAGRDRPWVCDGTQPLYVTVTPDGEQPYYAYGSVVYSPLNDPELVPALAATVAP